MRYLLVGNGPVSDDFEDRVRRASYVVQIDGCRHADRVPAKKARYVFVTDTGPEASPEVITALLERWLLLPVATVILSSDPTYTRLKGLALRIRGNRNWRFCRMSPAWETLRGLYRIERLTFIDRLVLDLLLARCGMPPSVNPSTGAVAYDWLRRRMGELDSLEIDGFTVEGREGHAWHVERAFVHPFDAAINPFEDGRPARTLMPPNPFSSVFLYWLAYMAAVAVATVVYSRRRAFGAPRHDEESAP